MEKIYLLAGIACPDDKYTFWFVIFLELESDYNDLLFLLCSKSFNKAIANPRTKSLALVVL